jgi:hypothetical protein
MKWFYLNENGDIVYLGVFHDIEDADNYITKNGIVANWILSETTAKEWIKQLTNHIR